MMSVYDVLYEWYCRVVCGVDDLFEWGKEHLEEPTEYFQDLVNCKIYAVFNCIDNRGQPLILETDEETFEHQIYSELSSEDRHNISRSIGDWMSDAIKRYNIKKKEEIKNWVEIDHYLDFHGTLTLTLEFKELVTHCSSHDSLSSSLFYILILSFLLSFAL